MGHDEVGTELRAGPRRDVDARRHGEGFPVCGDGHHHAMDREMPQPPPTPDLPDPAPSPDPSPSPQPDPESPEDELRREACMPIV